MTTMGFPDITCQKCGTVVPWAPYCTNCQAYLEFSGVPSWQPNAELPEPELSEEELAEAELAVTEDSYSELRAQEEVGGSSAEEVIILPVTTIEYIDEVESAPIPHDPGTDSAFTRWRRGFRRSIRKQLVGYMAAVVTVFVLVLLFGALSGFPQSVWLAPFLLIWAIYVIARFGTIADEDEYIEPTPEPEPELEAVMVEEEIWAAVEESNLSLESRAPQSLEAEEVHVTTALAHEVQRTVECTECQRMNVEGHRFCDMCGATLGNARVAPWVVPVIEEEVAEEPIGDLTEEGKRKRRRRASKEKKRRMSGSWRNPLIFLAILGLIASSLAFAFFGPGAFRFRFGLTRAIQIVTQFVDPYSGKSARIKEVTATSSLPGTSATEAGYSDARTFWASAPSVGFGVGTSLTYTFDSTVEINRMVIFPGIQSAQFDVRALAAPRTVTLSFDDGSKTTAQLDPLESTSDYRQLVKFGHEITEKVTLTIDAVYPPRGVPTSGIGSVAISGTEFLEVPAVPEFFGFQQGIIKPKLPTVQ